MFLELLNDLDDAEGVPDPLAFAAAIAIISNLMPEQQARLHPIEMLMLTDVIREPRHLKCAGCLRWMTKLIKKATT